MKHDHERGPSVLLGAALLVFAGHAVSQATTSPPTAAALQARTLAATCAACHGTDGRAVQGEAMVALAGYPKESLIAQMQAFRAGTRLATVMHQIASGYTDRQLESLATYFAAQPARRP